MSYKMLEKFIDGNVQCSAPDTFDDMQMGRWAKQLDVVPVHDDRFHQVQ
jgi:hypothetical protein